MTDRTDDRQPSRLVVEMNKRSVADLAWLTETEELNKTTVVNRAIQVYKFVLQAQLDGKPVMVGDERLVIV